MVRREHRKGAQAVPAGLCWRERNGENSSLFAFAVRNARCQRLKGTTEQSDRPPQAEGGEPAFLPGLLLLPAKGKQCHPEDSYKDLSWPSPPVS